jgi:hypothetical protein
MLRTDKYLSVFEGHWTYQLNSGAYVIAMFRDNCFLKKPWPKVQTINELFTIKGINGYV